MKKVIRKIIWVIGSLVLFICAYKVGNWIEISRFRNRCIDNQGVFYPQENICVVSRIEGQVKMISDYRLVGSWILVDSKKEKGFILYESGQIKAIGNLEFMYHEWKATNRLLFFINGNIKKCYLYSFSQNDLLVLREPQGKTQECQIDDHTIFSFSKKYIYQRMGFQIDK